MLRAYLFLLPDSLVKLGSVAQPDGNVEHDSGSHSLAQHIACYRPVNTCWGPVCDTKRWSMQGLTARDTCDVFQPKSRSSALREDKPTESLPNGLRPQTMDGAPSKIAERWLRLCADLLLTLKPLELWWLLCPAMSCYV